MKQVSYLLFVYQLRRPFCLNLNQISSPLIYSHSSIYFSFKTLVLILNCKFTSLIARQKVGDKSPKQSVFCSKCDVLAVGRSLGNLRNQKLSVDGAQREEKGERLRLDREKSHGSAHAGSPRPRFKNFLFYCHCQGKPRVVLRMQNAAVNEWREHGSFLLSSYSISPKVKMRPAHTSQSCQFMTQVGKSE